MSHQPSRIETRLRSVLALSFILLIPTVSGLPAGCDDQDEQQIRKYRTGKAIPPPEPDTMLEPPPAVSEAILQWDAPPGWENAPNPTNTPFANMRFATLTAGEGEGRIEVAISHLSGAGGGVAANINRWRQQLGLAPEADPEFSEIKARGTQGAFVDLVGPVSGASDGEPLRMFAAIFPSSDRTWFIKTTATGRQLDAHREGFLNLCRSVRFGQASDAAVASAPPIPRESIPSGSGGQTWDLPDGWEQDPQPVTMSVASFRVRDGGQEALVSITPLESSPNLLGNINRWRRQVGMGPLASLDDDPPIPLEVDGESGHLVDLAGTSRHTLGVITTRGTTTWFYKMSGPDPLVSGQVDAFKSFVGSIRFGGTTGG